MKAIYMLLGFCLVEAGLVLACAANQGHSQTTVTDIPRVLISAQVPGWYWFCVEDEYLARTHCAFTVQEIRQLIAHQRAAE